MDEATKTYDINNIVIDRVLRGVALSNTDDSLMFAINQITNPSLTLSSEFTEAVDAMGVPFQTFYHAKTCEFSAENALFDLNLLSTQSGTKKQVASDAEKVTTPAFETIDIDGTATTYKLKHVPAVAPDKVYKMNGDSTIGDVYTKDSSASATAFTIASDVLTPPTGLEKGDQLFVIYDYEATRAVAVTNTAKDFPTGCKFVMEILCTDVCDSTKMIYAYLVFPNFKISPDFEWSATTDSTHSFSGKAMQDYCDKEKKLFQLIIPDEE